MPSYEDPTFDEKQRELTKITQQAIVEWLRRRGTFVMPKLKRRTTARRRGGGESRSDVVARSRNGMTRTRKHITDVGA